MKNKIRIIVRAILRARDHETVLDCIDRHKAHIRKIFNNRKVSIIRFKELLKKAGVSEGDTLIVHCAWRNCFMLEATPTEVITAIQSVIGTNGVLLMPCYPYDYTTYIINNDKSAAGVLSEVFRQMPETIRSFFPKGTMCGQGCRAKEILEPHVNSIYQFDENSPYYKAIVEHNAKILLLGMGKSTSKITAFHCGAYASRLNNTVLADTYNRIIDSEIVFPNGQIIKKRFLDRIDGCCNDQKIFKKLFKSVEKVAISECGLSLVCFSGRNAFDASYKYCCEGNNLYHYSHKKR